MAEIKKVNGRSLIDYMARDYDSLLQSMRDQIPAKLPEWTDYTSEADFGNVLLELFAHMGDILSYYQDRIANESFLGTAQTRRSIIQHLRLIGYRLSTASPAAAKLVLTIPSTVTDVLTISKGDAFATKSQKDKRSVRFEYTRETPLQINCATLPVDPTNPNKKIYADGIPVEEGRLVKDEVLGVSDGTPNQHFMLSHAGVILRSFNTTQQVNQDILLLTKQGEIIETWRLRESLAFSREQQRDFILEIDEQDRATVIFGDGAFGFIPPSGRLIKVTYRVGGGAFGNVSANTIQTIASAPQLTLVGAKVTNLALASGGADRESIEHAVMHAPKVFRSLKRAVTADDYKALALDFNGVSKVRAEPTNWNTVTLYIAPEGGGQVSDVLESNLLAYFEDKRPITTIIEIANVDYVKIYITATVGVESYYSRNEIKEKVEGAVATLLALENVDFKQTIYLSKFYEAIASIAGVAYANITEFRRQGEVPGSIEKDGKIELGSDELAIAPQAPNDPDYSNGIKLTLEGGG
ncbi:baseplate J/gp47 family protein [Cyanobacteria bacterium FACHB-472]|nr:baseplate J/gp47 family protein [Cyanobacteria bacterium FACHB-472]